VYLSIAGNVLLTSCTKILIVTLLIVDSWRKRKGEALFSQFFPYFPNGLYINILKGSDLLVGQIGVLD